MTDTTAKTWALCKSCSALFELGKVHNCPGVYLPVGATETFGPATVSTGPFGNAVFAAPRDAHDLEMLSLFKRIAVALEKLAKLAAKE